MRFDFFQTRPDAHIRRAQEYLQQANVARIEHQTAAEHHAALAAMYAQRVVWLERELSDAMTGRMPSLRGNAQKPVETIKQVETVKRVPESIFALARQRPSAENAA